jgi:hypothetical protein
MDTPANAVAGIGGAWDDAPSGHASLFIDAPFDHGDFDSMMGFRDSSGVNPQSIIDSDVDAKPIPDKDQSNKK